MEQVEKLFGLAGGFWIIVAGFNTYDSGLEFLLGIPWWFHAGALACFYIGVFRPFSRPRVPRPKKVKRGKEKPRKFATPPTARVAEIKPQSVAERGMDKDLQRFVAKGHQAIQDEQNAP